MIMHLGSQTTFKSKYFFAKSIRKAMANQVAYEKIQEIKEEEKKSEEDAKRKADENKVNEPEGQS